MRSSHIIMRRAFTSKNRVTSSRRNKKKQTDLLQKLRKHIKPFVVVCEESSHNGIKHVLPEDFNGGTHSTLTPAENGDPSIDRQGDSALEKFVVDYDEVVIVKDVAVKEFALTESVIADIVWLLIQTLDRRVTKIACQTFGLPHKQMLVIGIVLDPEYAFDNVIKGPAANDVRLSAEFRKLWGKWSECRRFPDLSTCEAVYFPAKTMAEKRNISQSIVEHVLKHHFRIPSKFVVSLSSDVNQLLKPPETPASSYGTGEEILHHISHSLEDLIRRFRQLKNLPLSITAIQGISAAFRGAEVWPRPAAIKHQTDAYPTHVHEVVMNLESSGKWPDDMNALRAVKFQFICELCSQIQSELSIRCKPAPAYCDVFHEGLVFRMIPSVKKEVSLMRQVKSSTGVLTAAIDSCEEADRLYTQNDILPKITGALNGISTRFLSYAATCRLVKRWISSQFMDGYLDELVAELLVAQIFISTDAPPSSPLSGFRRFLHLVATFPMAKEPLLVDLNHSFTEKDTAAIRSFYSKLEHKPFLFLVTPYDRRFGMFSKVRGSINSPGVVKLLVECASKCHRLLISLLSNPDASSLTPLFHHKVEKPHVVIHLKKKLPVVSPDFNSHPVRDYLKNLRRSFDDFAVFLHDFYSGSDVIVYWKSLAFQSRKFDQLSLADKVLLDADANHRDRVMSVNVEGLVESFECLGREVVHEIEVRAENWPV